MKITLLTGKIFDISEAVGREIKVVMVAGSRRLSIRIDHKERVPVLNVPKYCSRRRAIAFVRENEDWIEENLQKLPPVKVFKNGESVLLFGETVQICHQPQSRRGVWLENGVLGVSGGEEFLHRRVKDYIKKRAAEEFYIKSQQLAQTLGRRLNGVSIKDTKSRWGSCSSLHNINYSWRIALAPQCVIDYLLAHEVAHLKHADHSADFWACVAELNPDWQRGHNWLQKHGRELYAYV